MLDEDFGIGEHKGTSEIGTVSSSDGTSGGFLIWV